MGPYYGLLPARTLQHPKYRSRNNVHIHIKLHAYRQITTIAELREGLQLPERHRLRNEEVYFDDLVASIKISTSKHNSKHRDARYM
ncbi:hypothetical protein V8C40DRAFT_238605 [Trichoderma camerunense]